jgi:hypothetical protein
MTKRQKNIEEKRIWDKKGGQLEWVLSTQKEMADEE